MLQITKINENIHRVTLPYKDIFTTVCTIRTPAGVVLFDAGSFDTDAGDYIVPFLEEVGVRKEELKYICNAASKALQNLKRFLPTVTL